MLCRSEIGAFASPDAIQWAPALPKTRSGKTTRRFLTLTLTLTLTLILTLTLTLTLALTLTRRTRGPARRECAQL